MSEQITTNQPNYKSVPVGADMLRSIRQFVGDFPNMEEAAKALKIRRGTLSLILTRKTTNSKTLGKIATVIQPVKA